MTKKVLFPPNWCRNRAQFLSTPSENGKRKGIKLNDKAYFSTEANYTLNQHWSFNLNANINGSGTPVKAINKGVYTKDIGFSTTLFYSDIFQVGLGGGVMKFDDGNLRKEANFWLNLNTFKNMTVGR